MRPPPRTLDRLSLRAIVQLLIEKVGPVHAIYLGQKAGAVGMSFGTSDRIGLHLTTTSEST